jgi:carbon storage regulator
MLYLSRRVGEAVIINNAIEVRVVEVRGKTVKLGLSFPADASVLREEVFVQVRRENEAAAEAAAALSEAAAGLVPRHRRRAREP